MKLTIAPSSPLSGLAKIPGDKSISHRAALFAALANGRSTIRNYLTSGVTTAMLEALTDLGVVWKLNGQTLTVIGNGLDGLTSPAAPINCGNSATTIRLLAGALAESGIDATLDGSPGLRRRPMRRIVDPLRQMGVPIHASEGGCAPLILTKRPRSKKLSSQDIDLPVASAQVKTCLLLAALSSDGPITITEPALSRDHTERMLSYMGVNLSTNITQDNPSVTITPPDPFRLNPLDLDIPGDFSAAAFVMVAAAITPGSKVSIQGVGLNPTRTGLLKSLIEMGADISIELESIHSGEPVGNIVIQHSNLSAVSITGERVVQMIDEFPAFAIAASYAQGKTIVREAQELRYKESDRITSVCENLKAIGVQVEEMPDGFIIHGTGRVRGGVTLDPQGDHRLAMSFGIAGLASEKPITIENAEIISESFPSFSQVLRGLNANISIQENE
jgi:3-phosphoshikimate 1-carboxyvinyltransferase